MTANRQDQVLFDSEPELDGFGFQPLPLSLDDRLMELEANLIRWALHVTGGNKSRAAVLLKVKRSTLGDRIHRCGIGTGSDSVEAV